MFLNRNFNAETMNTRADRRKEDTIHYSLMYKNADSACWSVCVCVCPVHSCKIGIRWFWWHTSFISTSWKGRGFLILVWFQRNWFMWFMWLKRLFQEGTVFSTSLSGLNQVSTEGSWICLLKFSSIFDATSWNFCRFVLCGQFGSCGYHETTLGEVQGRCLDRRSLIESMS